MNTNGKQTPAVKRIILEPNKAPQMHGPWSVGEVRQMAQLLAAWLDSIPLSATPDEQPQPETEQA